MRLFVFLGMIALGITLGFGAVETGHALASLHRRVPEEWIRVYISSSCPFSQTALALK